MIKPLKKFVAEYTGVNVSLDPRLLFVHGSNHPRVDGPGVHAEGGPYSVVNSASDRCARARFKPRPLTAEKFEVRLYSHDWTETRCD